jgi:phosphopantetheine--protein transferase-like protein
MAIVGIGIEIIAVDESSDSALQGEYYRSQLTDRELAYCLAKADPRQSAAARIAAKRAVMKAVGNSSLDPKQIEVIQDGNAPVSLTLHLTHAMPRIHITITHDGPYSAPLAIAETDDNS